MKKKLWGGRFSDSNSDITERLSRSVHYDSRLYRQDIQGSKAHSNMLYSIGVLTKDERDSIHNGLDTIEKEIESGTLKFKSEYEDIHMNIEARLTELIGVTGKKLHTARSRNDQIAVDTKMYVRAEINEIVTLLVSFINQLIEHAENEIDTLIPGYTHLQIAQPVRLSHHLLAHCWALLRDKNRLQFFLSELNINPLGVGALSGVNYPANRYMTTQELEFDSPSENSMDTVADRDYILDTLYACAVLGTHLSRMCEELVLWSSYEFGFIRLSDAVTTGSSIMPQKKNPDLAELIRGKTGRLNGNLISLLTVLKGLPLTYNRDLQEDKEGLFDSLDTIKLSLEGMSAMFKDIEFNRKKMEEGLYGNFSTATDLADYLVTIGVPFRSSHEIVGSIVAYCEKKDRDFYDITIDELKNFSEFFTEEALEVLDVAGSTERKKSYGSTSKESITIQIQNLKKRLRDNK
jgi:argininosuccinate lyase